MTRPTSITLLLSGLLASPVAAQSSAPALQDARWASFLGCWRADSDPAGTGARVCVTPSADGVTLTTVIANQVVRTETRVANGQSRPVTDGECRGTETARWSPRAVRVYRTASVACSGEPARELSTVSFLLEGPTWVDVETVRQANQPDGEVSVRASRLVRAKSQSLPDGALVRTAEPPRASSLEVITRWTVDDVVELTQSLPADGVQAAISEAPTTFRLNAKALAAMADAGVNDRVIDLMVGLTYPSRFVVQRQLSPSAVGMPMGSFMYDPFYAPLLGPAAMFTCYAPYGWAGSSYWSNCARYDAYRWSANPYYYAGYLDAWNNGWVVTQATGGGGTGDATPQVEGRVVNGRGYTQVRPLDPTSFAGGGAAGGAYSGSSRGGDTSSSGSSGVSSSGYSGGGASAGGGDRTAVPRGPGGE